MKFITVDEWMNSLSQYERIQSEAQIRQAWKAAQDALRSQPQPAEAVTGWRLLEVGEVMQDGDEMYFDEWEKVLICGDKVNKAVVRRRLPAPTQAALPDSVRAVDGAGLIAQERQRQISKEGYSPEHDDGHTSGELARAAACYAIEDFVIDDDSYFLEWWPWEEQWWKPQDRTTNLIRAGALIAAEIDRLQRAALTALDAGAGKGGE